MAKNSKHITIERFKSRCFVGLNKVTLYTPEGEVLEGDKWLELTDEQSRRNMMLAFFAPRDLNGEPMDPATVLFDEGEEGADVELLQQMKSISMFDMCRAQKAPPNTVHVILVADVIFHWDAQDNYIQPTSDDTWVEDLQEVLKGYPRTTEKHIYTDWEIPPKTDLGEAKTHPMQEMPLDQSMWINQPTFQEQYGTKVFLAGILLAVLAYAGLGYQESQIEEVNQKTRQLNAKSNLYPNFKNLQNKVTELENLSRYRGLFSFTFKDIALAVTDINMKLDSLTLQDPNPRKAPEFFISRLKAETEDYPTFNEQEPLAENLMKASLTIEKIRKPTVSPNSETFTLEGLTSLESVAEKHKQARQQQMSGRRQTLREEEG